MGNEHFLERGSRNQPSFSIKVGLGDFILCQLGAKKSCDNNKTMPKSQIRMEMEAHFLLFLLQKHAALFAHVTS